MRAKEAAQASDESWVEDELAASEFGDARLASRYRQVARQLWEGLGKSIPTACQDWANTKAAYRFFSNERVDEDGLLGGHYQCTRERFQASDAMVLVLQDTTEFTSAARRPQAPAKQTEGGVLMHSSLAVTTHGVPLGLAAIKFWTRDVKRAARASKAKVNSTRVPIQDKESHRWLDNLRQSTQRLGQADRCVHVADREGDIFGLFALAQELGTHFLVRSAQDRRTRKEGYTLARELQEVNLQGLHRIEVRDLHEQVLQVELEVRYQRVWVLPPQGVQAKGQALCLTVIHAQERGEPQGRKKIDWRLITDLEVNSTEQAIQKLDWYALRWRIETFHKILKSGCKAEESKLVTAQRLTNLICVLCILGWRVFWLTMVNRECTNAPPGEVLTRTELAVLDRMAPDRKSQAPMRPKTLNDYIVKIARLGGYLARATDPPPGNLVIWRGLSRLSDIVWGMQIGAEVVGN